MSTPRWVIKLKNGMSGMRNALPLINWEEHLSCLLEMHRNLIKSYSSPKCSDKNPGKTRIIKRKWNARNKSRPPPGDVSTRSGFGFLADFFFHALTAIILAIAKVWGKPCIICRMDGPLKMPTHRGSNMIHWLSLNVIDILQTFPQKHAREDIAEQRSQNRKKG